MSQVFGLVAIADGSVRKCQPFAEDSLCPSCEAVGASHRPVDDQFIERTCPNCATRWREFS